LKINPEDGKTIQGVWEILEGGTEWGIDFHVIYKKVG
jgi:hypothetical protein